MGLASGQQGWGQEGTLSNHIAPGRAEQRLGEKAVREGGLGGLRGV